MLIRVIDNGLTSYVPSPTAPRFWVRRWRASPSAWSSSAPAGESSTRSPTSPASSPICTSPRPVFTHAWSRAPILRRPAGAAGLGTRLVSLPLAFTMVIAILTAKRPDIDGLTALVGFEEWSYLVIFIWIALAAPGRCRWTH